MGKAGRFACIFVPMALSLASLVCLVLVFLGNQSPHNSTTNKLYFFRADTTNFTSTANLDLVKGTNIDNQLASEVLGKLQAGDLKDIYQVGLFDYCSGDRNGTNNAVDLTFCSKPKSNYFFNITEVWGLDTSATEGEIPKTLSHAISVYKTVSHWMYIAYVVALACTAGTIFVGFFAIFSRWGSCVTSLVSAAAGLFTVAAAATSTALSAVVVGALDTTLKPYGVDASIGGSMLTVVWLAVAFSLAASLFWTVSTCCCSGKSGARRDGGIRRQGTLVEQGRYTHEYKPLDDPPYGQHARGDSQQQQQFHHHDAGASVPMHTFTPQVQHPAYGQPSYAQQSYGQSAYEPYRTTA